MIVPRDKRYLPADLRESIPIADEDRDFCVFGAFAGKNRACVFPRLDFPQGREAAKLSFRG